MYKGSNNETIFFYYNGVNFLHVNGHTAVRPGMACVPLGKSLVKSGLDLGDRGGCQVNNYPG